MATYKPDCTQGPRFDTVFLPGWEEGLFPSQRTMDGSSLAGLEEERRLAYVGLTRAKKRTTRVVCREKPPRAWQPTGRARCPRASSQNCRRITSIWWSMKASMAATPASATTPTRRSAAPTTAPARRAQENRANANGFRTRPPMIEAYAIQTSDPSATQFARGERAPPEIRLQDHQRRRRQQTAVDFDKPTARRGNRPVRAEA